MTTIIAEDPQWFTTGIVLGAYPADTDWSIQWQRAPDSSGSPDTANAEIIRTVPASQRRIVDRLPDDGARRHYRWRHVRGDCSTPGAWSDWVDDIPGTIPDPLPTIPPLDITIVIEKDHQESDFDSDGVMEGRLTLEVVEQQRKWDIDFFTRQGRGTTFSAGSSFTDQVDGDTMTQDVELIEKLNSYIRYEVTAAGGNVVAQAGIAVFDQDEIAEILAFSGHTDSSDNLLVSGRADTDTTKVHITITTDGTEPADPTAVNADFTVPDDASATSARRWANEDTSINASGGTEVRMKARGENSAGVLAPTDTIYTFEFFVPTEGGGPVVKESTEESDFDADDVVEGRLTLEVIRASGSFDIEFYIRQGRGSFPGTPTSTATSLSFGNTATQDVELVEKLNSFIKYIVLDAGTSTEVDGGVVTFDSDKIPEVLDLSASVDKQGDVLVSGRRDTDGQTTYFTVTTDGTAPADPDPTIPNHDQATTSSSWARIDTGVDASAGDTVRVKARAGTGTEASPARLGPVVEFSTDPQVQGTYLHATLDVTSETGTQVDVSADAVTGPSTVGPAQVQLESIVLGTPGITVDVAWTSTLPISHSYTKQAGAPRFIKARVRDTGASNAEGVPAVVHTRWSNARELVDNGALDGSFRVDMGATGVVNKLAQHITRSSDSASLDGVIQKISSAGDLLSNVRHGGLGVTRGLQTGIVADGGSVSFAQTFGNTPRIAFVPQKGLSQDTATTKQKIDMSAINTSTSGFDLRAKLVSATSTTNITDGFSSSQNAGSPETGASLSSTASAIYSNLEDANTVPATYTIGMSVNTTGLDSGSSITVHIWVNDGASSTNWTEVYSDSHPDGINSSVVTATFTESLGADYDIRITVTENLVPPAAGQTWSVTGHGEGDTLPGVEYDRSDSSTEQSMTPAAADNILWLAQDTGD